MRIISLACKNRFSKILSTITDVPSACVARAMYCACISVANPGYSSVVMSKPVNFLALRTRTVVLFTISISTPACSIFAITAPRCSGAQFEIVRSPRVIAPATRNVPASMRSGITVCSVPCNFSTPRIRSVEVPSPEISAPIFRSSTTKSVTSGSRAAFSSTVSPSASAAAIKIFSVPVTVIFSNTIRAPVNLPFGARASMYPCDVPISAPICSSAFKCKSTGRAPIAHPPGSETRAVPTRAINGPSVSTEARIVFTNSYGASAWFNFGASIT